MKDTGAERRNHVREPVQIQVEISSGPRKVRGVAEWLSFGGSFISVTPTFVPGTPVKVRFEAPGLTAPFEGNAKVVWVKKDRAMGVQFIRLPFSEMEKLEKLLMA